MIAKTHKGKLPEPGAKLLKLALDDMEVLMEDGRYEMDSGYWHAPDEDDGVCAVCLAGAVIANTLGRAPDKPVACLTTSELSDHNVNALRWLDAMRDGNARAYEESKKLDDLWARHVEPWKEFVGNGEAVDFILGMRVVQGFLEQHERR